MRVVAGHSGLMFAARITLAHFSVSLAMSLPKSAGEAESAVLSNSANRILHRHPRPHDDSRACNSAGAQHNLPGR
jgi:hypothetical protein